MNYNISSSNFNNPLLKDLLKTLCAYFATKGISYYVIGATARDLIIKQLLNQESARSTQDLDIAIAIPDWNQFEEISSDILKIAGFSKSRKQKQRFYFREVYELDIVPFGDIANNKGDIYWPPEGDVMMSVKGFNEVLSDFMTFRVDNEFEIKIASLSGLFVLKLNAWIDRNMSTSKDAEDLSYILGVYFDLFEERNYKQNRHQDIYDIEDFDVFVAGAILLAFDVVVLLTNDHVEYYCNVLKTELDAAEESRLIEQMMKFSRSITYDKVYRALSEIKKIFQSNCK